MAAQRLEDIAEPEDTSGGGTLESIAEGSNAPLGGFNASPMGTAVGAATGINMQTLLNAYREPLKTAARVGLPMLGAGLGSQGASSLISRVPYLGSTGVGPALARAATLTGGETAGAMAGTAAAQKATGEPIDWGQIANAGFWQALFSGGGQASSYLLGRAGGVSKPAAREAVGRPGFASGVPQGAEDDLAQRGVSRAENFPMTQGRHDLEDMIQAHDAAGNLLDARDIVNAAASVRAPGTSPEARMANRAQSTNLPHIEGEFADAARQNLSPATMNMPVTAQQADTIIQQSLTKPVAGEFSKRPGGKAYSETRGAARNAAAQEFYKKIAPGGEAAKAAQSAANDLKVLEDFNKNFGAGDLVGDPKLSAPGRYLSAGSGVAPNSATLLRKLKRFDEVSTRNGQPSNLAGDAVQLAQKIEWGAHDQRVIARIATIMGTGSLKDVGAWRDAIRGLARLSVRSQGRVGAAGRAGTVATFNQPDRKKQEATFESAMRSQLYP